MTGRLRHRPPPATAAARPWPLRATDFDVLVHVNNAASWAAVEDELDRVAPGRTPAAAEIEYRAAVDPGESVELRSTLTGDRLDCWLTTGTTTCGPRPWCGSAERRRADADAHPLRLNF